MTRLQRNQRGKPNRVRQQQARRGRRLLFELLEERRLLAIEPQLIEILIGARGSDPHELTNVNGTLFFSANDGIHGTELWKSDGTIAGTSMVKDIRSGSGGSSPAFLTNVGGTLYFRAQDGINGDELWKSDGTEAGTVMVKDIRPGSFSSNLAQLTNVNGTLFFRAADGIHGYELWKSDGTEHGTIMVKDIGSGTGASWPANLTNVSGTLFFTANDGNHGHELWKSDGTETGTMMVKDIRYGTRDSSTRYLSNVAGTLYFSANDGSHGHELWKSDGTDVGTKMVKDIWIGTGAASPRPMTNFAGTLFFTANKGSGGYTLWKSDGTEAGTIEIANVRSEAGAAPAFSSANVDGQLFFRGNDGTHGYELWKSDGTEAGTVLVKDIRSGIVSSFPRYLTNVCGTLFFRAYESIHGYELWQSDGTEAGTVLVHDIQPGANGSQPRHLTNISGTLFFTADDGIHGRELWMLTVGIAGSLEAALDASGNLTITDIHATGKDNLLSIHNDGAGNIVITDANELFTGTGDIPGASLSNGNKTLTVPLASIPGTKIIIHGAAGDDTLSVDLTNPLGKLLDFHGGDGEDVLVLIGGTTHTSRYTYVSAGDGSVALDPDGPGPLEPWTVTYTELVAISSTIASDVVELIYTGSDETINISEAGGGQTTTVSTLGGLTTFTNPTELLRIVATSGTDTINMGALANGYASIEILGENASDVVNFNGPIAFAADHGLTVLDVGTVNLPNPSSNILASGTGAVNITALRNIALASGSSLTAADGDITMSANQNAMPTAGAFTGISLDGASVSATSAGSITLAGRGGTVGESFGIQIQNDGQVNGTTGTSSIMLVADSMTLTSIPSVDAGSNAVVLRPHTAGTRIDLGGSDVLSGTPLTLGLTDAELDRITAGTLTIGDAATGPIAISAAITRPSTTDVYLVSGEGIVFDPGSIHTGGGALVLDPGTAVQPLTSGVDLTASSVSFSDGAQLAIRIDGTTADTEYTQLNVAGNVDLTGAKLAISGSYSPLVGDTFTIVNNDGSDPMMGTFTGLPEGAVIPNFLGVGLVATITYVGGDGNDAVLEVHAAEAVGVQVVAVAVPSATGSTALPSSLDMVALGSTYYVEVWVRDQTVPGVGVSGGWVDVNYTTAVANTVEVFNLDFDVEGLEGGEIDEAGGVVRDLGGGTTDGGVGVADQWARLAYVEFLAAELGQASFGLTPGSLQFALFDQGNVPWDLVDLGTPVIVDHIGATRIEMTVVEQPTATDGKGEVAVLPTSEDWVHEWQSFWVEIWVSTPESTTVGVAEAKVDLRYFSEYLTAEEIEHGPAFTLDKTGTIDDPQGLVASIGGRTEQPDVGDNAYVLLARVRFASTGDDQVPVDQAAGNIGPYDMQLGLDEGQTRLVGASEAAVPELATASETELWAVVYDIDDNNQIDFGDFSFFAAAFGKDAGPPRPNSPYVWWADFDKSGRVDFGDLAFFAPNFNKTRVAVQSGDQTLVFPPNFPDAWRAVPAAPGGEGEASASDLAQYPSSVSGRTWADSNGSQQVDGPLPAGMSGVELAHATLLQDLAPAVPLARGPGASDAMFARLGRADAQRISPWQPQPVDVPWVAPAGFRSALAEAAEHAYGRTSSWDPLEDVLSLLARQTPERLLEDILEPHDVTLSQADR